MSMRIAEGYVREAPLTAEVEGQTLAWTERLLIVRSLKQAQTAEAALRARLEKGKSALAALNDRRRGKKRFTDVESLRQAAEAILTRFSVTGLLRLTYVLLLRHPIRKLCRSNKKYQESVHERSVRSYRERPATVRRVIFPRVTAVVDEQAFFLAIGRLGWRVYATNAPTEQVGLTQAVLAYRSEYIIEMGFGRLKGQPLSIVPMYLSRDVLLILQELS
ncbi:MAG: hypothetical protein ABIG63_15505, partial [Chloroflexota bacterium]